MVFAELALVNSAVLWYSVLKIEMILEKVMTTQSFVGTRDARDARNILTGGKLLRTGGRLRLGGYWR